MEYKPRLADDLLADMLDAMGQSPLKVLSGAARRPLLRRWPVVRSVLMIQRAVMPSYSLHPSLAVASLGAGPDDLIADMRTFGFIFENLCMRDLRIYARTLDGTVLHYRDSNDLECDAVMHLANGRYGLIEMKIGGAEAIEHGAKTLKKLASMIDSDRMSAPSFLMVLTGVTRYPYRRDDGVLVVPVDCIGP